MSGRDLGEIKIIAGWSRYKSEMSTGVSVLGPKKSFKFLAPEYGRSKASFGGILVDNS